MSDAALPIKGGAAHCYGRRSCLGRLMQSKSDFSAIEHHRGDGFFEQASGTGWLPSSPTP
ncbi:MAG TPA: hypothetical protein PKB14_19780 [Rubrivivax sp.]|nr:hypothetical protein [Rubrivivax sp.]